MPSLLDFLYADHERVAPFLSQINAFGAPQSSEETGAKSRKSGKEAGLNLGPFSGKIGDETDWSKEVRLTYDPLWTNSLTAMSARVKHG